MPHLGVSELAYAEYPETGSEEGYTYTLLIAGTPEQAKAAKESYREVINSFGWDEVDQIDSESSDDISEEEQE